MSSDSAVAFLDRVERDDTFATELESLKNDPAAVLARVQDAGFEVNHAEVREAFLARYGEQLGPDQLARISAGVDGETIGAGVGAGIGAAGLVAAAAVFAAL